jgi:antitoxin component of MazEF toxin-antitoxin module
MKILQRLVKNGNSTQVTMPAKMLEQLQWRAGTAIIVELTACGSIEIRKPTMVDLHSANMPQSFELVS